MTGLGLLQTNTAFLFVLLMSIHMQKINVRDQSVPKILRIKEHSIAIDQEHARGRPAPQINTLCLFVSFMVIYIQKDKFSHQSVQEELKIKEYSNLIG